MEDIAPDIHVVRVHQADGVGDSRTVQFWVAAVPREKAEEAVQRRLPEGWSAELTDQTITAEHAARLDLRPGYVGEMTS